MKDTYFKIIGQKSSKDKMILVAVVPVDMLGRPVPDIFEAQAVKLSPTIYSKEIVVVFIRAEKGE